MRGNDLSKSRQRLVFAVGASLLVHGLVGVNLWGKAAKAPVVVDAVPPIMVELVEPPNRPALDATTSEAGPVSSVDAPASQNTAETPSAAVTPTVRPQIAPVPTVRRPQPAPAHIETVNAAVADDAPPMRLLGSAEMAGAARAGIAGAAGSGGGGGGGGGGQCDMVARLEGMVRRDARVQATVRQAQHALKAGGQAMLVWDGDWVQSSGQAGRGLAGLRQAIAVEVAFAPRECRVAPMRGMVVLSLGDTAGDPLIALGTEQWRWEQLSKR